jgi:hypothetical protein
MFINGEHYSDSDNLYTIFINLNINLCWNYICDISDICHFISYYKLTINIYDNILQK